MIILMLAIPLLMLWLMAMKVMIVWLGDDLLKGGNGDNLLTGQEGADIFVVGSGGIDTIADFNFAEADKIYISSWELGISSDDSLSYNVGEHKLY